MSRQKPYWYYRLKFSWPGRLFTRIKYPILKVQFEVSKKYYAAVLQQSGGLVFDIGANVGDLSRVFLAMGYRVVACEPDPENFRVLKARFSGEKRVVLLQKAVAHHSGMALIYQAAAHGGSLSTLSEKRKHQLDGLWDEEGVINFDAPKAVETVSLDELVATYGAPIFIKIDVEGFEQEVLSGLSQPVQMLSFEANLPEFMEETIACLKFLKGIAGDAVYNASTDDCTLVFDQFQNFEHFYHWFEHQQATYAEIFCRMQVNKK